MGSLAHINTLSRQRPKAFNLACTFTVSWLGSPSMASCKVSSTPYGFHTAVDYI